jgi:hypothetical protein
MSQASAEERTSLAQNARRLRLAGSQADPEARPGTGFSLGAGLDELLEPPQEEEKVVVPPREEQMREKLKQQRLAAKKARNAAQAALERKQSKGGSSPAASSPLAPRSLPEASSNTSSLLAPRPTPEEARQPDGLSTGAPHARRNAPKPPRRASPQLIPPFKGDAAQPAGGSDAESRAAARMEQRRARREAEEASQLEAEAEEASLQAERERQVRQEATQQAKSERKTQAAFQKAAHQAKLDRLRGLLGGIDGASGRSPAMSFPGSASSSTNGASGPPPYSRELDASWQRGDVDRNRDKSGGKAKERQVSRTKSQRTLSESLALAARQNLCEAPASITAILEGRPATTHRPGSAANRLASNNRSDMAMEDVDEGIFTPRQPSASEQPTATNAPAPLASRKNAASRSAARMSDQAPPTWC